MFDIKENLKNLPDKPGVYLHKDKEGNVIYVGKAVSLKRRVRQYFQSSSNMDRKVRAMVSHIKEFEYIITETEMEALLLEERLIKKYMPKYNALYGKNAVFYASIVEMVNNIFLFTIGIILIQLSAGVKAKINLKGMLTPGMFGIIIGFALFLLNLELPGFIGDSISIIGAATTPLSMIVIGVQLGHISIKELLGDKNLYLLSFMKLLIIPAAVFLLLRFGLKDVSLLAKVIIIEFAMPVAACTTIFSQQYNGDVAFSTKGVMLTTIFSIITIPIFAVLLTL
jgi:hypothetical protein